MTADEYHALEYARQQQSEAGFEIDADHLAETISYHTDIPVTGKDVRRWRRLRLLRAPDKDNPSNAIPTRWTPATVKRLRGGRVQVRIGGRR